MLSKLKALSPIDGRYNDHVYELSEYFSEFALMKSRVFIEVEWIKTLTNLNELFNRSSLKPLSNQAKIFLQNIYANFNETDAEHIKTIENKINHDVKSIEYFLKEKMSTNEELNFYTEFVHFACTSDDINNLAYALLIKAALKAVIIPALANLVIILSHLAQNYANIAIISRTHGQPATPTTMGKELANFAMRLNHQINNLKEIPIMGKFNGTVGNFSAHYAAFPEINWISVCQNFVETLGLKWNLLTTQIEPHDYIAEICHCLIHCNNIIINLNRDIWGYIALNYFIQNPNQDEIGSSVMPHKVNPIDFENAEGNLGIANSLLEHFANKLIISRWQRDLTDSTVLRNFGVGFAHSLIAFKYTCNGLKKITINKTLVTKELDEHWEVLAEAIQTVMRSYGINNSYEILKNLTRGKKITKETLEVFINELDIPAHAKDLLLALTPSKYIGKSASLTKYLSDITL